MKTLPAQIPITIVDEDGGLVISSPETRAGTQFENEAVEFVFIRPEGYENDDLILLLEPALNNGLNLGAANSYALPTERNRATQQTMQVGFQDTAGRRELSNFIRFDLRQSTHAAGRTE